MRATTTIIIKLLISAAVSIGLILLVLRLSGAWGPDAGPGVVDVLFATAGSGLAIYFGLHLISSYFRALRFRLLLAAGADRPPPGVGHTMLVSLVRNMMVDMLPARLGELSYIALMNRGYRVPGERCVSSLAMSFIFDLIALVGLILALVVLELFVEATPLPLPVMFAALAVPVAAVCAVLFYGVGPIMQALRRLAGARAERRLIARLLGFGDRVAAAITATAGGGVLGRVLALSFAVRLTKYGALYAIFLAVTRVSMPDLHQASFLQVMLGLIGGEAGASLALPTLMGFGAYEAGSVVALSWAGFTAANVAVAMLALHIWSQCIDYLLGGLAFVLFLFTTPGTPRLALTPATRRRLLAATALGLAIVVGAGAWAWHQRTLRKAGATAPPPPGHAVEPLDTDTAAGRALTAGLHGFVVWSSNRDGNHDIFRLNLPEGHLVPLTRHPHVDYFPRIAPDGRRIVFCRSQEPWISQRNRTDWDVYLLDLETGEERLVALSGNGPTWAPDGQHIYFQRHGNTLVRHHLESGEETVLFDGPARNLPANTNLENPSMSADGARLATTLRGGIRQSTVIMLPEGDMRRVGGGCQLTWGPDDQYLYYVDRVDRRLNEFYRVDPATLERITWLSITGEYNHAYFPRVSNDGAYLVYGASTGGHEQDQADYEIFLWRIDDPPEAIARLSFHTGNDCWPDLFLYTPDSRENP